MAILAPRYDPGAVRIEYYRYLVGRQAAKQRGKTKPQALLFAARVHPMIRWADASGGAGRLVNTQLGRGKRGGVDDERSVPGANAALSRAAASARSR